MPPDPIAPFPLVRRGDRVFPVRALQQLLCARNHDVSVDGIFGPQTESAVKAFQQEKSLGADGIVGPATWSRLVVQVKRGSTGGAVRGVQEVIKFHDQSGGEAPPVHVDGVFGARTDAFVRGFRRPSARMTTASSARSRDVRWSAACSRGSGGHDEGSRPRGSAPRHRRDGARRASTRSSRCRPQRRRRCAAASPARKRSSPVRSRRERGRRACGLRSVSAPARRSSR